MYDVTASELGAEKKTRASRTRKAEITTAVQALVRPNNPRALPTPQCTAAAAARGIRSSRKQRDYHAALRALGQTDDKSCLRPDEARYINNAWAEYK